MVLEAPKGAKTLARLSSNFGVHAQQITECSGILVEKAGTRWNTNNFRVTDQQTDTQHRATGADRKPYFRQIGQLKPGHTLYPYTNCTGSLDLYLRAYPDRRKLPEGLSN